MKYYLLICTLLITASSNAIVVNDFEIAEQPPADLDWSFVYNYKGSSAVALDRYWVLTAAHVADDGGTGSLSIDGENYLQLEIIYHAGADLALVRYNKALPGYYSLFTGDLEPAGSLQAILVGYGTRGTAATSSWTDSGTGRGVKRWGTQRIYDKTIYNYYAGGETGSTSNHGFWMDFDSSDSDYEAGTGSGDSGGGTFVKEGNTWKLAGINTSRSGAGGIYGSTFAVSMPDYAEWVAANIPEPSVASLIIVFGSGLLFFNRIVE